MALIIEDTDQFWPASDYLTSLSIGIGSNILNYFSDLGDVDYIAKIIGYNGSVVTVGGDNQLSDDVSDSLHVNNLGASTTKAIFALSDISATEINLSVLTISGTTITLGTKAPVVAATSIANNLTVGMNTAGDKGLIWYRRTGPASWLARFTVSGTTVVVGTPQSHVQGSDLFVVSSMIGLDADRVLLAGENLSTGKFALQVVNISSGITEGTLSDTDQTGGSENLKNLITLLESNKALLTMPIANSVKVRTVNISGNTISSYGADLDLYPATETVKWSAIDMIDSTTAVLFHIANDSGTIKAFVETLAISGDTVTQNGDQIALSPATVVAGVGAAFTTTPDGIIIAAYKGTGSTGEASAISGAPAPASSFAQFYFGVGTLAEKFTLPFSGVAPKGMTLDKSLGTVVIGSKTGGTIPIIYSTHPYPTGIATNEAFPTGTSISAVRWI